MKTSVNCWMLGGFEGEVPVVEAAKTAKAQGYDAIELCFGAGELLPETPADDLAALKVAIDEVGIEVASLATGFYWGASLGAADEVERAKAGTFTEAYLKAGAAFGVDAVLVVPGSVDVGWDPSRPVVPAKQVWEQSHKSIEALLPTAEEVGVAIAVENVWSKFLTGPFEYVSYIDSFNSPFVKAYFDVGNCLINGYPEHWIELLGSRIARVHLKNFTRQECGGLLGGFTASLLEGDINWANVFGALKAAGYDGYLTAEMIVSENGMPDVEHSAKIAKQMASLVEQHA